MTNDDAYELYFETRELDDCLRALEAARVTLVHGVREQPWGQRCFRAHDPEGRLVEIGEPMQFVAERFLDAGLSVEQVAERTMLPEEMVRSISNRNG